MSPHPWAYYVTGPKRALTASGGDEEGSGLVWSDMGRRYGFGMAMAMA